MVNNILSLPSKINYSCICVYVRESLSLWLLTEVDVGRKVYLSKLGRGITTSFCKQIYGWIVSHFTWDKKKISVNEWEGDLHESPLNNKPLSKSPICIASGVISSGRSLCFSSRAKCNRCSSPLSPKCGMMLNKAVNGTETILSWKTG